MNFNPPASTVVFERLPAGSAIPAVPPGYITGDDLSKDPGWVNLPSVKLLLQRQGRSIFVDRVPYCWLRFLQASQQLPQMNLAGPQNLVFCHVLRDPHGNSRLVTVSLDSIREIGDFLDRELHPTVYAPPTSGGAAYHTQGWGWNFSGEAIPFPRRFFAGQTDSADGSHFTIEYEWPNGVHGFIDGYLRANNHVDIAVRPGPGDVGSARKSYEFNERAWRLNRPG
jgi:hypothetical protein